MTATQLVITDYDMQSLKPAAWLNDMVISSFFSVVKLTEKNSNAKEILYISTFMFCALLGMNNNEYDYANANRCIKKKDLFAAKVIFVPINVESSHWILGCIFPRECRIELFDSGKWIAKHLSNCKNIDITRAKHYGMALLYLMEDRAKSTGLIFEINKWSIVDKYCPQQKNGWDCGVSVCIVAFFMSNDLPLNYNHAFLEKRRRDIKYSILLRDRSITTEVTQEELKRESALLYDDRVIKDLSNVRCDFDISSRFGPNFTSVIPREVICLIMPILGNSDWVSFVQCCKVENCASKYVGFAKDESDDKIGDDSTKRKDILTAPGEYSYVGGVELFYRNGMIQTFTNPGLFYLSSSSITM
jgi:hypothetical protein